MQPPATEIYYPDGKTNIVDNLKADFGQKFNKNKRDIQPYKVI